MANGTVVASMLARGSYNINAGMLASIPANKGHISQLRSNIIAIMPQLRAHVQRTGAPVYIVGTISSTTVNGTKVALSAPVVTNNRRYFGCAYNLLTASGVPCINPASTVQFAISVKAGKQFVNKHKTVPPLFAATGAANGMQRTIKRLHRANKRFARGAACVLLVNWQHSLLSGGVAMEVAMAHKHGVAIYAV